MKDPSDEREGENGSPLTTSDAVDIDSANGTNGPEVAPVITPVVIIPGCRAGVASGFRLEQAICNEPHDEEDEIEWEAQEKNVEWWTEENGIHNTDRRDNHGVDKPSIHVDLSNAEVVGEPGKEAEDNHRTGQLQESQEDRRDLVCSTAALLLHVDQRESGVEIGDE